MRNILSFIIIIASFSSSAYGYELDRTFELGHAIPSECIEIHFSKTRFIGIISVQGMAGLKQSKIVATKLDERLLVHLPTEAASVVSGSKKERGKFCSLTYSSPISAQMVEALLASDNISLYESNTDSFVPAVNVRRIWSRSTIEYIMSVPKESGALPLFANLNIISHAR